MLIVVHVVAAGFPGEGYLRESSGLAVFAKGKRVTSAAKTIIYNICKYFERQPSKSKCRGPPQVTRKTTEATGYPDLRVRSIMGEKPSFCGAAFTSPAKRYKVDRKTVRSNDFDLEAMRSLVHDLYCEKKYPTLDSLLLTAKEKGLNSEERVTL